MRRKGKLPVGIYLGCSGCLFLLLASWLPLWQGLGSRGENFWGMLASVFEAAELSGQLARKLVLSNVAVTAAAIAVGVALGVVGLWGRREKTK